VPYERDDRLLALNGPSEELSDEFKVWAREAGFE